MIQRASRSPIMSPPVNPARAGMIPETGVEASTQAGNPRASGDDPSHYGSRGIVVE